MHKPQCFLGNAVATTIHRIRSGQHREGDEGLARPRPK